MLSLKLCNDRTEVDMNRLAQAFSITRTELEDCLRLGTISYWYELGSGAYDTPEMVFRSHETGRRIALDRVGNVVFRSDEGPKRASPQSEGQVSGSADLLPSEAPKETLPASHPITVGVEADRLVA